MVEWGGILNPVKGTALNLSRKERNKQSRDEKIINIKNDNCNII